MRVYKGKIAARSKGIYLYTFLRISPRKINILKKIKLDLRELNEVNSMNAKKKYCSMFNIIDILKSITKMPEKMKKNKSAQNFFILKYIIEFFKASKFYY